ncbi:MAG: amylo-alpha-1,6-glucosidase [Pseudomonadota bacterium]
MTLSITLEQTPQPGSQRLLVCGDVITIRLRVSRGADGSAFVRTNIGMAARKRAEVIDEVDDRQARLGTDWFDVPMRAVGKGAFEIRLALRQPGHFGAKCLFISVDAPSRPVWPPGDNAIINVMPAVCVAANTIYNAFIRQFGPAKRAARPLTQRQADVVRYLDEHHYTVIPPSGTFRDFIVELDVIIGTLGCRIIQLLPVHPTPTTYARMGRFGSPYAALGFTAVDPALAVFDPAATPLEQFFELLDAVHRRGALLILDMAVNHTGWAARLHEIHPEWLVRDSEGRIKNPGAWGVVWEDLTHLDYRHRELWQFMAEVFLTWCRRGVDGFRCDAGYMIPERAWQYIIARVRDQFPETLFLLEGLGGKISVTRALLNHGGFDMAYSELFQNYDRGAITHYLPGADRISREEGINVHFAETHDNNRLAARSRTWARLRTALAALTSQRGAFAFTNGVEWFATEKINVHDATSLNWGAEPNQLAFIRRLSALLCTHICFVDPVDLSLIQDGDAEALVVLRRHLTADRWLLVVSNLSDTQPVAAQWRREQLPDPGADFTDLLTGETVSVNTAGGYCRHHLEAGQIRCLSPDSRDLSALDARVNTPGPFHEVVHLQRAKALVLEVLHQLHGQPVIDPDLDLDAAARALLEAPGPFYRTLQGTHQEPRLVRWRWPEDLRRTVMVPPGHGLLVTADASFRVRVEAGARVLCGQDSFQRGDGRHFCLLPLVSGAAPQDAELLVWYHGDGARSRHSAQLKLLPDARFRPDLTLAYDRRNVLKNPLVFLGTNGRGAMVRAHARWGYLASRYDALLAVNPDPNVPVDRWVLLSRCRMWVVFQDYSLTVNEDCLTRFHVQPGGWALWVYDVPVGQGEHIRLEVSVTMPEATEAARVYCHRLPACQPDHLDDARPVRIIVRPDIESRSFHATTKAYLGPEQHWPGAVHATQNGFSFTPKGVPGLRMTVDAGRFVAEPEWHYMVHRPLEAERGLDPDSDLYSPGYFTMDLGGGDTTVLDAVMVEATGQAVVLQAHPGPAPPDFEAMLEAALSQYVVRRDAGQSVIAGYPWFLDWGRDTLIACRGLIAVGALDTATHIVTAYARLEKAGTLPNMLAGSDDSNRNTSDAPLWLAVACRDLTRAGGNAVLERACGQRSLKNVLVDMAHALEAGAPNGVRMDPASGLLFSPVHFTWMDTNHPAGTPREGYPIEIQALWQATLGFLAEISSGNAAKHWVALRKKVRKTIGERFFLPGSGYLADCLQASPGVSCREAAADDALRCNQLLAVTLGALEDREMAERVLSACQCLLVPGGIRSLADRPVSRPLVITHGAQVLGDPLRPYRGHYAGDEDTMRKPAYHNGTAWTWPYPVYAEAWYRVYGDAGKTTARAYLLASMDLFRTGCVGHLPEIMDGDSPHRPRGCDAQAWGLSEWLRVWRMVG